MGAGDEDHLGGSRAAALHGGCMVVFYAVDAPFDLLVGEALLVVALEISHSRAGCAVILHGVHAGERRVGRPSHGILAAGVVDVGPVELAVGGHLVLFLGAGEVLVDEVSVGVDLAHRVVEALHAGHARRVVGVGGGVAGILVGAVVAQSFHEVETETVDLILREPEFQGVAELLLNRGELLFPVVEHAVGMGCRGVEEGVASR